ncbi:alcohol dehydrogenase [Azoarcus sp. Aa7]|nr:alcohol dehydrogenase [Azoarcus sp. Aa7]
MKALRYVGAGLPPVVEDVPVPIPGPGEVLVKIGGAGVCHSDLHVLDHGAQGAGSKPAFTLGHENAGWVAAWGAGVQGLREGDPVAVYGYWGCGHCRPCQSSMENYCENADDVPQAGGGFGLDGGMAEYMLVPSPRLLVPLGSLDPRAAAPLTDAALTPYHAIKRALPLLTPDANVVVIGVGGLGHMAVQLLRVMCGSRIVAVDLDDGRLEHARQLGADLVVNSRNGAQAAETIRAFCGPRRAALVLDFVGLQPTLDLAVQLVGRNSQLTVVGVGGGVLQLSQMTLPFGCSVCTPLWGSRAELLEVIALAQYGRIQVDAHYFGIEDGPRVLQDMRAGKVHGRGVLVPGLN